MKKSVLLSLILSLFFVAPAHAQTPDATTATTTLDEWISPQELSEELGLEEEPQDLLYEGPSLTPEEVYDLYGVSVYSEFPVVAVINKAAYGQTMSVYSYGRLVRTMAVSTGRERWESPPSGRTYFSTTPTGWFSPKRYIKDYWSSTWNASMDFAIFFNGGIAVHATTPSHYAELGRRASGGCVRLHRDNASWFWYLSQSHRQAYVPYFTRGGTLIRDSKGNIRRHTGNGTLIIVTNY